VSAKFQLRLWVLLVSAVVTLVAWKWIPGTPLDRAAFATVARGSANGPLFISGAGTHVDPWKLRTFSSDAKPDRRQAPLIVSLGDDLQGFFQTNPPAPIDLAVILSNFQRLGAKKAATAAVFAWEKPDPIGLAALEKSLAGFDSLVMTVPLSRGVVAAPMPPTLRRASIPVGKIKGDAAALPLVNRLPIPGVILGGESTITGFSVLESEPPLKFLPLMARWEDRVVFSFSLLTVLQRLDLPLDGVEVRLGEFLKLGPSGPILPIDEAGRLAMPLKPISGYAEISAEALIDGGDELFPKQAPDPVILRDDQTAADPTTRAFSRGVAAAIAAIASSGGLTEAAEFPNLSEGWEILLLSVVVLAMTALCGASQFARYLGTAGLAGVLLVAQWSAFGIASIWLPGLPFLIVIISALVVALVLEKKPSLLEIQPLQPSYHEPEPEPEPELEPEPEPELAIKMPKTKTKKAPAKKAATKKTAAKKTTAKTTAATKTPRTKKPPSDS
jgi:hypothetical protein